MAKIKISQATNTTPQDGDFIPVGRSGLAQALNTTFAQLRAYLGNLSSRHKIQQAGVDKADRDNLNFAGPILATDDAGNNRTTISVPEATTSASGLMPAVDHKKVNSPYLPNLITHPTSPGNDVLLGARTKVVFFGDSITHGRGVTSDIQSTNGLDLKPAADWPGTYTATTWSIFGMGVNGNTTVDALARLNTDVLSKNPNVVGMQFGWNDSCSPTDSITLSAFETNMRSLIEQIQAHDNQTGYNGGRVKVVLYTNPPAWEAGSLHSTNNPTYLNTTVAPYNTKITELAAEYNCSLVDLNTLITAGATNMTDDGVHLTDAGYLAMYNAVSTAVFALLDANKIPTPVDAPLRSAGADKSLQINKAGVLSGANFISVDESAGALFPMLLNKTNADLSTANRYAVLGVISESSAASPSANAELTGLAIAAQYKGNGNLTSVFGSFQSGRHLGTGTVSALAGFQVDTRVTGGGTVTYSYGLRVATPTISGAGSNIVNDYGLYIQPRAGTNKWALYAEDASLSSLGGIVESRSGGFKFPDGTMQSTAGGLPSQTGNAGKFLTTDGTSASWVSNSGLQYQGTNASGPLLLYYSADGKAHNSYLTDDGFGNVSIPTGKTYNINGVPHTHFNVNPSDTQILFSDGANNPAGSTEYTWNKTTLTADIASNGSTNPQYTLTGTGTAQGKILFYRKVSGGVPVSGTVLGSQYFYGWNGSAYALGAAVQAKADVTFDGSNNDTHLELYSKKGTSLKQFNLESNGNIRQLNPAIPSTTTSAGTAGEIAIDAANGYLYLCIATNTWRRVAINGTW